MLIIIIVLNVIYMHTIAVINRSVGLDSNSQSIGCARIQQAYVSSKVISVRTDRDKMLR